MRTWKRIASALCATMMLLSLLSMSVFAAEVPVSFALEDGTQVTLYDPDLTVSVLEAPAVMPLIDMSGTAYIPKAQQSQHATSVSPFVADVGGRISISVTIFDGGPTYNVALVKQTGSSASTTDPVIGLLEECSKNSVYSFGGIEANQNYYFRLSTYGTPGMASYSVWN